MRTTPTTPRTTERPAAPATDHGADFEAPLHTVPYPTVSLRGASLDARDVDMDDLVPYRADA